MNIEQLKTKRKEEAKKWIKEATKSKAKKKKKNEKRKVKEDIRRIKAARLRSKFGVSDIKMKPKNLDVNKTLSKKIKFMGKLFKAIAESTAEYSERGYAKTKPQTRRRKRKNRL